MTDVVTDETDAIVCNRRNGQTDAAGRNGCNGRDWA